MWRKIYLQSVFKQGVHDHPIPSPLHQKVLGMPQQSKSKINYTIGHAKGEKLGGTTE